MYMFYVEYVAGQKVFVENLTSRKAKMYYNKMLKNTPDDVKRFGWKMQ